VNVSKVYLPKNEYSRPGTLLKEVRGLALHWVGNPGTSAIFNRNYFELRKNGALGYGSAHFVVGLEGEVIQCMPEEEMAYHVGAIQYTDFARNRFGDYPNNCLLGIETCHLDWEGRYPVKTLTAACELCANLCERYDLDPLADITTHYAITRKVCPKWFVSHPQDLEQFQRAVRGLMIVHDSEGADGAV